jgi:hypothetical protein
LGLSRKKGFITTPDFFLRKKSVPSLAGGENGASLKLIFGSFLLYCFPYMLRMEGCPSEAKGGVARNA